MEAMTEKQTKFLEDKAREAAEIFQYWLDMLEQGHDNPNDIWHEETDRMMKEEETA